ncbi:hypothetical protein EJ065_2046 [Corallococcus coralloides]|uniref:Rad50/SbcC-type AAA domain-containing protein n=1 Tax=Corallococcus coralloides TaxID=184914 RepID=A0A410RP12_CORCK|nr:AAA family ATPase [Corallococcus coralloides]QAT83632.1 hypothetical protein EJ065_2046 [Corallococcus coralloides]
MARLAIRKVVYEGRNYSFASPILPDGLVIIEGENGAGKTTFADLVYYGLGGRVIQFQKDQGRRHLEIVGDSDNYVSLYLDLNGRNYRVTRYIGSNEVLVTSQEGEAVVLPIYRGKETKQTYSDWLLGALGIDVVTITMGQKAWKLNFSDLMRLIYHDQEPDPERIYKAPDQESFVSDSLDLRRAVFEILIGRASQEYYRSVGLLREIEREADETKGALRLFKDTVSRISFTSEDLNLHFLESRIREKAEQVERLTAHRNILQSQPLKGRSIEHDVSALQQSLAAHQLELSQMEERLRMLLLEKLRLTETKESLIQEILRIKKIISAHETLGLFTPDTCPCCLREVSRQPGYCICGLPIQEDEYTRYFYSTDEYLTILKSRQKNIETLDLASVACSQESVEISRQKEQLESKTKAVYAQLQALLSEPMASAHTEESRRIDDRLVELRIEVENLQRQQQLEQQRMVLEDDLNSFQSRRENAKQRVDELYLELKRDLGQKRDRFDAIYNVLMVKSVKGCRRAHIDSDTYMPIINNGEYREASAGVAKRLMYYLTLFNLSVTLPDVSFPRFLLIDTPETAGIDTQNLELAISMIQEVLPINAPGQIILTTGVGKYPADLTSTRVLTLTDEEKLLWRKEPGKD